MTLCRYAKYLEEEKPERKPVAKGDQYQVELDELDHEAAAVAEVRCLTCLSQQVCRCET